MTNELYHPGLEGVIAGETAISTIEGGLQYRGYAIEDLAAHATFEEVAHLLLHGELPTGEQLDAFRARLAQSAQVAYQILALLAQIPVPAPDMDVLRTSVSALAHFDPDLGDDSHEANVRKAERLLAQIPVALAARHRLKKQQQAVPPSELHGIAANLLFMLGGEEPSTELERAMDITLILYAEHEYNASTFTARVVASTLSDLHSGITGAIGALKGPLHGGANERVMELLLKFESADDAERWARDALARKERIMGFGHRVYKTGDPRAAFLKPHCRKLAEATGNTKLEEIAERIESIVTSEKKLPPNLDWPAGRLYYYMGLDIDLYTPLFVASRVAGWSAHVIEQLDNNRLIRPRARYTGEKGRKFVPLAERK